MKYSLILAALATSAAASSPEAWDTWRQEVATTCLAALPDGQIAAIQVNPWGSESYGAAILDLPSGERLVCIFDKRSKAAELTAPFAPAD
ncbi:MAG: hypothetical protein Q4G24_10850 [Paracoccus sp. (in: a-proteobacteria)]|uniref:hypothetical protein n=1 Tax=Paracoccus sp. TaxID=267 RepID=UPI0026DF7629|nr:hypothetical protein [Paracoccus sp. (in: a-proteobacteria)]MDO5621957.1 hypothetical protein [Paracoccus sp. (in: a-proteobacteria)]